MSLMQSPNAIVMIRPWHFHPNPETAADNAFQRSALPGDTDVADRARREFDAMVATLEGEGVRVHVFDDYGEHETPDSVFPNNWFSTHPGGHVAVYPMYAPGRRRERRYDVINMLKAEYRVQDVIDFSGLEWDDL
ncbi:MAG: arginine deiminase-related protein, partial [Aggregatilineales bacterium]